MKTVSKALIYIVLACLLLSWGGGLRRTLHRSLLENRIGRTHPRVLARVRRCRGNNPAHHPVRPSTNAVLPPDDDEEDRVRLQCKAPHGRWHSLCHNPTPHFHAPQSGSRPLPTEAPRHQTLCILLI
jgi:hypothetical protein